MGKAWLLACVVSVASLTSSAFAELSFATNASYTFTGTGEFVNGSGSDVSAVDNAVYSFSFHQNSVNLGTQPSITYTFLFGGAVKPSGDPTMVLYMPQVWITGGPTSQLLVTTAQWEDSTQGGATASLNTIGAGYDINAGVNNGANFQIPGSSDGSNYTTSGGFSFNYFDRLVLTIQLAGSTGDAALLNFDAVANPEPGTMALFGLGALGLGGIAWRRRRAKTAAK